MKREHAARITVIMVKAVEARFITQDEASMLIKQLAADQMPKVKKSVSPKKGT